MISDELSARSIIQNLTITAPCHCALKKAKLIPEDEAAILDLLSPLKRIDVPKAVKISLHNDVRGKGIQSPCPETACRDLTSTIQASIGRLDGEPLSGQEAEWKKAKDLLSVDKEKAKEEGQEYDYDWQGVHEIWNCLTGYGYTTFDRAVQSFHGRRRRDQGKEMQDNHNIEQQVERDDDLQKPEKEQVGQEMAQVDTSAIKT